LISDEESDVTRPEQTPREWPESERLPSRWALTCSWRRGSRGSGLSRRKIWATDDLDVGFGGEERGQVASEGLGAGAANALVQ
jgi:hypothetical protein